MSSLSSAATVHLVFAAGSLLLGPFALWLKKGTRLHRAAGYAWVTLMLGAAVSSLFMRRFDAPNLAGYTAIHLVTVATFVGVGLGVWHIVHGRIARHRRVMQITYASIVVAGMFAMSPQRFLGERLWSQALAMV